MPYCLFNYTYSHTYVHTRVFVRTWTCIYTYIQIHMHMYMHLYVSVNIMHTYTRTHVHHTRIHTHKTRERVVCVSARVCTHACACKLTFKLRGRRIKLFLKKNIYIYNYNLMKNIYRNKAIFWLFLQMLFFFFLYSMEYNSNHT